MTQTDQKEGQVTDQCQGHQIGQGQGQQNLITSPPPRAE